MENFELIAEILAIIFGFWFLIFSMNQYLKLEEREYMLKSFVVSRFFIALVIIIASVILLIKTSYKLFP